MCLACLAGPRDPQDRRAAWAWVLLAVARAGKVLARVERVVERVVMEARKRRSRRLTKFQYREKKRKDRERERASLCACRERETESECVCMCENMWLKHFKFGSIGPQSRQNTKGCDAREPV